VVRQQQQQWQQQQQQQKSRLVVPYLMILRPFQTLQQHSIASMMA
jgi:hypothetical protein